MSGLVRAESLFRARRRARRRQTARPVLAAAIITTVVGGAVWLGFSSPLFRLQSITVKGTSRLSEAEVLAVSGVRTGGSLLAVPLGSVRARVLGLAPVASVRVGRDWPHGLEIDVTERAPAAVVGVGGGHDAGELLLDRNGVAFTTTATAPADLLDLRVDPPAVGASTAASRAAMAVWSTLPPGVRRQVRWMSAASADSVSFGLAQGCTVVWGSPGGEADKLSVLAVLMRRPASTYDVSTPSVAVTR